MRHRPFLSYSHYYIIMQTQKTKSLEKSNLPSRNSSSLPRSGSPSSRDVPPGSSLPLQPSPHHTTPPTLAGTKTVGYSGAVKKNSGGPSGSLTSEGTEYESSGEEGPQPEENGTTHSLLPAGAGKFPLAQQRQQQVWQSKPAKPPPPPLSPRHGTTTGSVLTGTVYNKSSEVHGSPSNIITEHTDRIQQQEAPSSLVGIKGKRHSNETPPPPIKSARRPEEQESPYLARKPLQGSSPKDSWPLIDGHKELPGDGGGDSTPPPNTMIYAAIMANKVTTPTAPPTLITSPKDKFPSSAIFIPPTPPKASFSNSYNIEPVEIGAVTAISSSSSLPSLSMLPGMYPSSQSMAQSIKYNLSNSLVSPPDVHAGLGSSTAASPPIHGRGIISPAHLHHHQFDSKLPASMSTHTSSTYVISRGHSYGYQNINRDHTPYSSYGGMTSIPSSASLPFTTVAAGKEMRNLLGIDGDQRMTTPPIYTEGGGRSHHHHYHPPRGHNPAVVSDSVPVVSKPIAVDSTTQTMQLLSSKEIQVGPDMTVQSSQTESFSGKEATAQTEGVYVPVQEILPPPDAHIEYIGMIPSQSRVDFVLCFAYNCYITFSPSSR